MFYPVELSKEIFVATVGGQPQVVTFALDQLLETNHLISEVIVLHFHPQTAQAQKKLVYLKTELQGERYQSYGFQVRFVPIQAGRRQLGDIRDEADAHIAWEVVHQLLGSLKREGYTLQVCVSGGRRMLALIIFSVALVMFGHQDLLWHMYTPEEIQQEAEGGMMMHLPAKSEFRLIRVPLLPWGSYFPQMQQLAIPPLGGGDVLTEHRALLDVGEQRKCRQVYNQLSPRPQELLFWLAKGLTPQQAADKMCLTLKTVDTYKTTIFAEYRTVWGLPERPRLNYHFIADKFKHFPFSVDKNRPEWT